MKYSYLGFLFTILIVSSICESTSFLKNSNANNEIIDIPETPEPKLYRGICFIKIKGHLYDLNPLNTIKPWSIKDVKGNSIKFNFCSDIETKCSESDVLIANDKSCRKFAGKAEKEKIWTIETDKKTKKSSIILKFPPGDPCGRNKNYQTTVKLTCDPKAKVPVITNNKTFDKEKCENVIKFTSKDGNNYLIYKFINYKIFKIILNNFSLHHWKIQCMV